MLLKLFMIYQTNKFENITIHLKTGSLDFGEVDIRDLAVIAKRLMFT